MTSTQILVHKGGGGQEQGFWRFAEGLNQSSDLSAAQVTSWKHKYFFHEIFIPFKDKKFLL